MPVADLSFVDANVLIYALNEGSEYHRACIDLIERAERGEISLCLAPQTFAECYAVLTDPRRVTDPYEPEEALTELETILAMPGVTLLPVPVDLLARLRELLRRFHIKGGDVFDAQLVATMLGNGIRRIYTYNRSDFEPFEDIEVLIP